MKDIKKILLIKDLEYTPIIYIYKTVRYKLYKNCIHYY